MLFLAQEIFDFLVHQKPLACFFGKKHAAIQRQVVFDIYVRLFVLSVRGF